MTASAVVDAPTHGVALPATVWISPDDTPARTEKYFGMRAFGCGAELFPHLGLREARALRLLNKLMNVVVDRRAWVRISVGITVCVCVCVCVCVDVRLCLRMHA